MSRSILTASLIEDAKCIAAVLKNCDLTDVSFKGSDVERANFSNSRLNGANMDCVDIELSILFGAIFDDDTIWPKDFDPRAFGAIYEE